jgi:pyruvate formate-lyase/glycerol dehydratase family glycyl radical enzyme
MINNNVHGSPWTPSDRTLTLLRDHHSSVPSIGVERAIHYTEFYKYEADKYTSVSMRRAKALAYHLEKRSIQIHDGEMIVGSHTEHRIGAICHVELAGNFMLEDLFKFQTRKTNPLHLDAKSRRTLMFKVFPYWLFRNLVAKSFSFLDGLKYIAQQLSATSFIINEAGGIAHFLPNYEDLLQLGTMGIRKKIESALADGHSLTTEQSDFHCAGLAALDAFEQFAERYRKLAESLDRTDLVQILSRVPRHPARNLREALQMIWFFQMVIQMESLDQGISLGRIDQYLYPYYLSEKEEGVFDEDDFKNRLCALSLKMSEVIPLFSSRVTEYFAGLPTGQAATIGGIKSNGEDAVNALSFMILEVMDKFRIRQPNWHARIHKATSPDFVKAAMDVISHGSGSPALYNDEAIIPAMLGRGYAAEKVWNYATVGCVEPALPGESFTSSDAALFNLPVVLERVLLGTGNSGSGKRGLNQINTMDELMDAVKSEMSCQINYMKYCLDRVEASNACNFPTPFASLTVEGCIDSARDLASGGASFNASGIQGVGLADIANSLAAIEEVVFQKKEYSLRDIASACKDNFKRAETLRAKLLKAPKFGNDHKMVDEIARKLMHQFNDLISENTNTRGGRWIPGFYSMTCHRGMGKYTSALPSGRLKGEALADGLAPSDGSDVLGPTASLNSVAHLDHTMCANGINLNVKFDARTLKGEQGAALLQALIGGYFDQGGMQIQVNVLDPSVLLEAQKHPEKHRNLLVRVSGYCSHFVDLTPAMQDEIIQRTLQHV